MSGFDSSSVLDFFLDEAGEYIQGLTNGFLAMGDNPGDQATIHELFRVAHTLKGSSAMMGFNGVSRIAHKMEDLLGKARSGSMVLAEEHIDILFGGLDAIRDRLERIRAGEEEETEEPVELLDRLEAACIGRGASPGFSKPVHSQPAPSIQSRPAPVAQSQPAPVAQSQPAPSIQPRPAPPDQQAVPAPVISRNEVSAKPEVTSPQSKPAHLVAEAGSRLVSSHGVALDDFSNLIEIPIGDDSLNGILKVRSFFVEEATEHIVNLKGVLDELRFDLGNSDLSSKAEKIARTMKGSAVMLGFERIGRVADKVERLFININSGSGILDYGILNILYDIAEAIGKTVKDVEAGRPERVNILSFINRINPYLRSMADSHHREASATFTEGGHESQSPPAHSHGDRLQTFVTAPGSVDAAHGQIGEVHAKSKELPHMPPEVSPKSVTVPAKVAASTLPDFFTQECADSLDRFNECVCDLEMDGDIQSKIAEIYRISHTLKGSAAMVGVHGLAKVAGAVEECLSRVKSGDVIFSRDNVEALFEVSDKMKAVVEEADRGLESHGIEETVARLNLQFLGRVEVLAPQVRSASKDVSTKGGFRPPQPVRQGPDAPMIIRNIPDESQEAMFMRSPSVTLDQIGGAIIGETLAPTFIHPMIIRNIPDEPALSSRTASQPSRRTDPVQPLGSSVSAMAAADGTTSAIPDRVPAETSPGANAGSTFSAVASARAGVKASKPQTSMGASTVRVDIDKLDSLLNLLGELVIHKIRLDQRVDTLGNVVERLNVNQGKLFYLGRDLDEFRSESDLRSTYVASLDSEYYEAMIGGTRLHQFNEFDEFSLDLGKIIQAMSDTSQELDQLADDLNFSILNVGKITNELQEKIMKVRMLPVQRVFEKFPRVVRDLSRKLGKRIRLQIEGEETELDKTVLEKIGDPLMHLLRNTIDHGIEMPDERTASGKDPEGLVTLKAYYRGNHIFIEVSDDGRGISPVRIRRAIQEKGLLTDADVSKMTDSEVIKVIFQPGFSTAEKVTDVSGRGVGMDVVKNNIEMLKGVIDIDSTPGRGTSFIIKLPLTLAIIQALIVEASGQKFCIPLSSVLETMKIGEEEIDEVGDKEVIFLRDEVISLVYLGSALGLGNRSDTGEKKYPVVIVSTVSEKLGLVVDHLYGKQEIVIKTLGDFLEKVSNITGATILGDGQVMLIVDVSGIINQANRIGGSLFHLKVTEPVQEKRRRTIMVVDDSLTIRNIERNLLQSAGYGVITAENGLEALEKLHYEKIDILITDVEMPKMNGYTLTREVRTDPKLKGIPIIMITTKSQEADRLRGLKAGADVYIGKPFIQATLLDTIAKMLDRDGREAIAGEGGA